MLMAVEVIDYPSQIRIVNKYFKALNQRLNKGNAALFMSGKVSLYGKIMILNIRYWIGDLKLFNWLYWFQLKKGLRKTGYTGRLRKLSSNELSELLEGLI